MSILTLLDGSRLFGSAQVFDHPSDAYKSFECSCGGAVHPVETPDFETDLLSYHCMARCQSCERSYFVVGVADASMMDEARFEILGFFDALKDEGL